LISRLKPSLRDQIILKHPSQSYLNFFGDRDLCIEAAENILIKNYEVERVNSPELIWEDIIKDTSNIESVAQFKSYFTERKSKKGEFLIRQGDDGSELYIISSGKFDVFIQAVEDDNQLIRVRSMTAGSIFGESIIYSDLKRTASVRAEEDSTVFVLTKTDMAKMEKEFPRLANYLHRKIVGTMSERLKSLNRLISRLDP
jgi:CRP-like cAMP-binding protein